MEDDLRPVAEAGGLEFVDGEAEKAPSPIVRPPEATLPASS